MHIFFSGIGGTATSGLALIAHQMGHQISGSDLQPSSYISYLEQQGISNIYIGQTAESISNLHKRTPIDWFVFSSAVSISNPNHPELLFCKENNIKISKRDDLINEILSQNNLKLLAVSGTHGKTTTTAMAIWLFKQLEIPVSYLVGAKTNFSPMAHYDPRSEYFIYECDEFDRNFLAFHPYISIISGVSWDHHEIFPTETDYIEAFQQFTEQSQSVVLWQEDSKILNKSSITKARVEDTSNPNINDIKLTGLYNRRDAWLVVCALQQLTNESPEKLIELINSFPGVSRRFEKLAENLYTDYAHTPEKITGAIDVAKEALTKDQKIVVVYEPLTNRRIHYTKDLHKNLFDIVDYLYWVPSFLAREDPAQDILTPTELIDSLSDTSKSKAKPKELNEDLKSTIDTHLSSGDLVLCLSGGGTGSLDDWLRKNFT